MSGEKIEYQSETYTCNKNTDVLETIKPDGVNCVWSGKLIGKEKSFKYSWTFDFNEILKKPNVNALSGYIIVRRIPNDPPRGRPITETTRIDVELTKDAPVVRKIIPNEDGDQFPKVSFKYILTPIFIPKIVYEEIFAATDKTDTVLIVEGKHLHVNKAFLSIHSEFFSALFSTNFKEGGMKEIPIKDVTFEAFGMLMALVHPKQVFPNDKNVEKLLELADKFLMVYATNLIEFWLSNGSKLSNEKLMLMADMYGMPKLLEKSVQEMDTKLKTKRLYKSEEYKKLRPVDNVIPLVFNKLCFMNKV